MSPCASSSGLGYLLSQLGGADLAQIHPEVLPNANTTPSDISANTGPAFQSSGCYAQLIPFADSPK